MSWDVLLIRPRNPTASVAELSDKDDVLPLGPLSSVLTELAAALPTLDLSDPTWGRLDSETFSIEFNIGDQDPVDTVMLHVRGGDEALASVRAAAAALACAVLDCSEGEFIDWNDDDPAAGLARWRAYRNQVVGDEE